MEIKGELIFLNSIVNFNFKNKFLFNVRARVMSVIRVFDHSKINFYRINEGPMNLSISINTFLCMNKQIFTQRVAHSVIYGSAWHDKNRACTSFLDWWCVTSIRDASGDIKSFTLLVTFNDNMNHLRFI